MELTLIDLIQLYIMELFIENSFILKRVIFEWFKSSFNQICNYIVIRHTVISYSTITSFHMLLLYLL